ncbi:MAG: hypothetical protein QM733_05565 [Ilumatobacteraceae bacterium]
MRDVPRDPQQVAGVQVPAVAADPDLHAPERIHASWCSGWRWVP